MLNLTEGEFTFNNVELEFGKFPKEGSELVVTVVDTVLALSTLELTAELIPNVGNAGLAGICAG